LRQQADPLGDQRRPSRPLQFDGVEGRDQIVAVLSLLDPLQYHVIAKACGHGDRCDESHPVEAIVQLVSDLSGSVLEAKRPTQRAEKCEELKPEKHGRAERTIGPGKFGIDVIRVRVAGDPGKFVDLALRNTGPLGDVDLLADVLLQLSDRKVT
jgi:hypothetical protein